MTQIIDLAFTVLFMLLAIGCLVVFLATGMKRWDLLFYGICSAILFYTMLRSFINSIQKA